MRTSDAKAPGVAAAAPILGQAQAQSKAAAQSAPAQAWKAVFKGYRNLTHAERVQELARLRDARTLPRVDAADVVHEVALGLRRAQLQAIYETLPSKFAVHDWNAAQRLEGMPLCPLSDPRHERTMAHRQVVMEAIVDVAKTAQRNAMGEAATGQVATNPDRVKVENLIKLAQLQPKGHPSQRDRWVAFELNQAALLAIFSRSHCPELRHAFPPDSAIDFARAGREQAKHEVAKYLSAVCQAHPLTARLSQLTAISRPDLRALATLPPAERTAALWRLETWLLALYMSVPRDTALHHLARALDSPLKSATPQTRQIELDFREAQLRAIYSSYATVRTRDDAARRSDEDSDRPSPHVAQCAEMEAVQRRVLDHFAHVGSTGAWLCRPIEAGDPHIDCGARIKMMDGSGGSQDIRRVSMQMTDGSTQICNVLTGQVLIDGEWVDVNMDFGSKGQDPSEVCSRMHARDEAQRDESDPPARDADSKGRSSSASSTAPVNASTGSR